MPLTARQGQAPRRKGSPRGKRQGQGHASPDRTVSPRAVSPERGSAVQGCDVRAHCLGGAVSAQCRTLAGEIEAALLLRSQQTPAARQPPARQVRSLSPPHPSSAVLDTTGLPNRDAAVQVSARYLASRYALSELHSLSAVEAPSHDGVASLCARRVLECDELCSRISAAMPTHDTPVHAPILEAARQLVSTELGRPYEECCDVAGAHLRPLLEGRAAVQAEALAGMLEVPEGGMLVDEVLALQNERQRLRTAVTQEQAEQRGLRHALNEDMADVVGRMAVLLAEYRVPSEEFDGHMATHLLALLEALQAKLQVLTSEVEAETYTPETISALRKIRDVVEERLSNTSLEESTMHGLAEQYASVVGDGRLGAEFTRLNDECRALEAEKASLEKELRI